MSFVNNYKRIPPPPKVLPESELYGPEPYDINYSLPFYPSTLECETLRMTPFVPAMHAQPYWDVVGPLGTEPFRHYPFYHATLPEFLTFLELKVRRNPEWLMFAIIDRTRPDAARSAFGGSLAGVIALANTQAHNLSTELGHIIVFPAFRGTHVAKTAVGLLLRYCLQPPTASPPGLGFRRVTWCAHPGNAPSLGLAQRMGFRREAYLRWLWVLPEAIAGNKPREGERGDGRDTIALSVCWTDWDNDVRDEVERVVGK